MRTLSILFITILISLTSCEKQDLLEDDQFKTIGYEVKGWSSKKSVSTSKSTTKFIIENDMFANVIGEHNHNGFTIVVKEMLLTSGSIENEDYEVFGSVAYSIDQEGYLNITTNRIDGYEDMRFAKGEYLIK